VDITLEEVQVLGKHLTGRPHFAKILLKKGYVKTNQGGVRPLLGRQCLGLG
jgi:hypothetical protein